MKKTNSYTYTKDGVTKTVSSSKDIPIGGTIVSQNGKVVNTKTGQVTKENYTGSTSRINTTTPTKITTPKATTTITPTKSIISPDTSFSLTSGNLQQGSSGDNVKQLQSILGISQDGYFGPQTKSAVMAFQEANGLTVDGIVGPKTTAVLSTGGNKNKSEEDQIIEPTTPETNIQTTDLNTEKQQIDENANTDMNTELSTILENGINIDTSNSVKLAETIESVLSKTGTYPTAPNMKELQATERQQLGIDTLEAQSNEVMNQLVQLDSNYTDLINGVDAQPLRSSVLSARKGNIKNNYDKSRAGILAKMEVISNQLTTKYGVLNTYMQYAQNDYSNAVSAYNSNYSRAMDLINLFKGITDEQKSEVEKAQDDAKANLQVVIDAIGDNDWSTMNSTTQALITKLETESGLPSGYTKALVELNKENSGLKFQSIGSSFTDSSGNRVTPVYYKNPSTGVISTDLITLGSSGTSGGKSTNTNTENVSIYSDFIKTGKDLDGNSFGNPMGSDRYADPGVYVTAFENWPGTVVQFLNAFPVVKYVNPASYNLLPESIRPKAKTSSSSSNTIEP